MKSSKLIYDNRFWRWLLRVAGRGLLRLGGWTVVGEVPKERKLVAIAAPHTSNWDFPLFMAIVGHFGLRVRYLGKHTLFRGPFGWFFYWFGGIPVDRNSPKARDRIDQAIDAFATHDELILGLAPEGTRSSVEKWKSGYYRIAVGAGVPIQIAYLDTSKKEIGLGPIIYPTGDAKADMAAIEAFYRDKVGVKPRG